MQHIIDLLGSHIFGGIVLLTLVGVVFYFTNYSHKAQLTDATQKTISEAGQVIEYDFNKLGYRVESGSKITSVNDSSISFNADLNNDGVIDSISYSFLSVNGKKVLRRYVSNQHNGTWNLFCKSGSITPRDSADASTFNISLIRSIELKVRLEQEEGTQMSSGSFWKRKFYPKNLRTTI